MSTRPLLTLLLALILAVSCAHAATGGRRIAVSPPEPTHPANSGAGSPAALKAAARTALAQNYRLSVYVLWHNTIPGWATQSTRGPALAALRSAALTRIARGVRIKTLFDRRDLVSLTLNATQTKATAVVTAHEHVQPSNRAGHPLGRSLTLNERGRFLLHRIGTRFVVWQVTALP